MATTTLKYGAYTHPLMPRVRIAAEPLLDDGGARIGTTEVWTIEGALIGTDQADLLAQIAALEAAYATVAADLILLAADGTTELRKLASASAVAGTQPTPIKYPGGEAPELATQRTYALNVKAGFLFAAADTFDARETTTFVVAQDGKTTRTVRGTLTTVQGVSADAEYTNVDPGTPPGYFRLSESKSVNAADNALEYEFVDREYFQPFPIGVLSGSAQRTDAVGPDGRATITIAGAFTGSGAAAAASAQKLTGAAVIREAVTAHAYTGEVSFAYEYASPAGGNAVELGEQIELSAAHTRIVARETLDGPPVLQTLGTVPARVVQSGHAVGRRSFPTFGPMAFAASNLVAPPVQRRIGPGPTQTDWRVEWRYEFAFPYTPPFPNPRTA